MGRKGLGKPSGPYRIQTEKATIMPEGVVTLLC